MKIKKSIQNVVCSVLRVIGMFIATPIIIALFLLMTSIFAIVVTGIWTWVFVLWMMGHPITFTRRVNSAGKFAGGKITETYRWFTKI